MAKTYIIVGPYHPYAPPMMNFLYENHNLKGIGISSSVEAKLFAFEEVRVGERFLVENYFCDSIALVQLIPALSARHDIIGVFPISEHDLVLATKIMELLPNLVRKFANRPEVLQRFRNKSQLKTFLRQVDKTLPLNHSRLVRTAQEVLQCRQEFGEAFVIKPNDGTSSHGIRLFKGHRNKEEVDGYFRNSGIKAAIMEDFIISKEVGREYAVNGQIDQEGKITFYSVNAYQKVAANSHAFLYYYEHHVASDAAEFSQLTEYAARVMTLTELRRCPFHMELILTNSGPILVEVGARLPGGQCAFAINDVHGGGFDIFAVAAHYHLFSQLFPGPKPNWESYNQNNFLIVTGINRYKTRIYNLHGVKYVEAQRFFRRWTTKPERGKKLFPTESLSTIPYEFQLLGKCSLIDLYAVAEKCRERILWNVKVSPKEYLGVLFELVLIRVLQLITKIEIKFIRKLLRN